MVLLSTDPPGPRGGGEMLEVMSLAETVHLDLELSRKVLIFPA